MSNYNSLGDSTDSGDLALQYQEQVSLLKAMFEEWDEPTLVRVIASNNGNAEAAIDTILAAGSASQFNAQQNPAPAPPPQQRQQQNFQQLQQGQHQAVLRSAMPPPQQDMVMVTAPIGSTTGSTLSIMHNGTSFHVQVPPGIAPGGQFIANVPRSGVTTVNQLQQQQQMQLQQQEQQRQQQRQQQQQQQQQAAPPQSRGRGKAVSLPSTFLRPPGWVEPAGGRNENELGAGEMTDEQLAILLQDEMFLQELAAHPEFQQEFQQTQQQPVDPQAPQTANNTARRSSGGGGGGMFSRGRNSNPNTAAASSSSSNAPVTAPSSSSSSWSTSMKNRLKSLGANFNRRQRNNDGYGTVGDSETNEESPFHWADDNVQETNEMITFSPSPREDIRRMTGDHNFPSQAQEPAQEDEEEDDETPTITGEELIASSLGEEVAPPKSLLRQPSGNEVEPLIDVEGECVEMTTPKPKNLGLNGNSEVYDV
jgi:hypothetical protein